MDNLISNLNKVFESRVRLGIMSILMVNDFMNFNDLKNHLEVTDGNLASHLKSLEKYKLIQVKKEFIGRKPNTKYSATKKGRIEFEKHLDALEKLIRNKD